MPRWIPLIAALLALTGCASDGATQVNGRTLVTNNDRGSGADALFSGTIAITDADCWGMQGTNGKIWAVAWPRGTKVQGDELLLPGIQEPLPIGASIDGGGGEANRADLPSGVDQCGTDPFLSFWNVSLSD